MRVKYPVALLGAADRQVVPFHAHGRTIGDFIGVRAEDGKDKAGSGVASHAVSSGRSRSRARVTKRRQLASKSFPAAASVSKAPAATTAIRCAATGATSLPAASSRKPSDQPALAAINAPAPT